MRTVSAALQAHLAEECTTLATCWEITRLDGVTFYFTSLDQDVVFGGNTYVSRSGYNRTAVASSSDFKTDNLDLTGFFEDDALLESDVRNGLFDFAEVLIFIVNYEDVGQGNLILRRGTLGEVESTPSGLFKAELRGLTQRLSQRVGDKFQAECRADLGDTKCKVPIQPGVVQRSTTYQVGDYLRASTGNPSALTYAVPLSNGGFESLLAGWTTFSGNPSVKTANGSFTAFEGTRFLEGASPSDGFQIFQIVDLTTALDFDSSAADNGEIAMNGSVRRATSSASQNDAGRFRVEALDENNSVLGELWNTGYEIAQPDATWVLRTVADAVLPAGTRRLRVWCEGDQNTGEIVNAAFDDIQLELVDAGGPAGLQEVYENTIYEVITAGTTATTQPAYNTVIGSQTTDGAVVVVAHEAWTRDAEVTAVTDNQTFTISVNEGRGNDGWFNGGGLSWESGQNQGLTEEIKDWNLTSGGVVTLFLPMPNSIGVGDRLRLYPGCDKRLATCNTKFRIAGSRDFDTGNRLNFRGEPYLPGRDALGRYPDAK